MRLEVFDRHPLDTVIACDHLHQKVLQKEAGFEIPDGRIANEFIVSSNLVRSTWCCPAPRQYLVAKTEAPRGLSLGMSWNVAMSRQHQIKHAGRNIFCWNRAPTRRLRAIEQRIDAVFGTYALRVLRKKTSFVVLSYLGNIRTGHPVEVNDLSG